MEDELIKTRQLLEEFQKFAVDSVNTVSQLAPHIERYAAMEELLTDPDKLAQYTVDYFTHVHPVPDRFNAAASLVRPDFPSMPVSAGGDGQLRLANIRPDQRWMVADKLERQGAFRNKPLVVQ